VLDGEGDADEALVGTSPVVSSCCVMNSSIAGVTPGPGSAWPPPAMNAAAGTL